MATSTQARPTAAQESWELIRRLWTANFPRVMAVCAEFDLAKQQAIALVNLEPDEPKPMSELAAQMFCDASNITGIVDRLEARGLVERRSAPVDRRVKALSVTTAGAAVRARLVERLYQVPPAIAELSPAERRTLLELLQRLVTPPPRPRPPRPRTR